MSQEVLDFTTPPRTRAGGHETSEQGDEAVAVRAGSQRHKLLLTYYYDTLSASGTMGLTDEEAAGLADLTHACYWKRCGELRAGGYITTMLGPDGEEQSRPGRAGVQRIICRITRQGVGAITAAMFAT